MKKAAVIVYIHLQTQVLHVRVGQESGSQPLYLILFYNNGSNNIIIVIIFITEEVIISNWNNKSKGHVII